MTMALILELVKACGVNMCLIQCYAPKIRW